MMKFIQFRIYLSLIVFLTVSTFGHAQDSPPGSDIFIASIDISHAKIIIGTPRNLTNRKGYDNQPAFTLDGKGFLYSSFRENGQTDIYHYDIESKISYSVTSTPESEYSPTPMRGKSTFSTVRVEMDDVQRLWQFNMDGTDPTVILDSVFNVGYHGWGDEFSVGLFIVGSPHTFNLANTVTGRSVLIAENSGRSIHKVPGENALSFVHKTAEDEWWIKKVDLKSRLVTPISRTIPGSEDYAWTSNGILLMAKSSSLYKLDPRVDDDWKMIVSFTESALRNIKRIAVSPNDDQLLMVSDRIEE